MRSTLFILLSSLTLAACTDPASLDATALADTTAACTARRPALPASAQADVRQTLQGIVASGAIPGAIATVDHPHYRTFSAAAGIADLATGDSAAPHDRIRAGSMLKTAVATAVLQLVERGTLSLDATLPELLPAAVSGRIAEADHITLRMLLSHTAGIPEPIDAAFHQQVFEDPTRIWTLDDYLTLSASHPRPFAPGAGWQYSNMDYILAGEILTTATGTSWREIVKHRVFDRARLEHSALPRPGHAECAGCMRGYEAVGGGFADLTEVDPSMASGAGGSALITTTEDLAAFLRALLAGELFDRPETLALMTSFVAAPLPQEGQVEYGLGLAHIQFAGVDLIGHYGSTAGYNGFMLEDTATGVVFTGAANADPALAQLVPPMIEAASRLP